MNPIPKLVAIIVFLVVGVGYATARSMSCGLGSGGLLPDSSPAEHVCFYATMTGLSEIPFCIIMIFFIWMFKWLWWHD